MNLKDRAKKLKTDIPAVFIAMKKRETPLAAKIFASVTVLYALSPIDLIPDFIPVLGFLDDLIILPAMIALTVKLVPTAVFKQAQIEVSKLPWLVINETEAAEPFAIRIAQRCAGEV